VLPALVVPSVIVFMLGAAIGSFLNVVIYRLPAGLSLLNPPSRCPRCLTRLRPYDNVPILGWLWLRGRCRYCAASISVRYPLVEALTGVLFLAAFWHTGLAWSTVGAWLLLSWLVALALIDLDTLTLPNALTQPGLLLGLGMQMLLGWQHQPAWSAAISGLMVGVGGMVLGLWLFELIALVASVGMGQTAMGGGDAKLVALLGAWLGWQGVLLSGFLACLLGAMAGGVARASGRLRQGQPMPFGPFLALGAVLTLFVGERLIGAYLSWFFPAV